MIDRYELMTVLTDVIGRSWPKRFLVLMYLQIYYIPHINIII